MTGADRDEIGILVFPDRGELGREGYALGAADGALEIAPLDGGVSDSFTFAALNAGTGGGSTPRLRPRRQRLQQPQHPQGTGRWVSRTF